MAASTCRLGIPWRSSTASLAAAAMRLIATFQCMTPSSMYSCDPRTSIPLDVVEGGYLPHFIDQIAGKLAMALELAGLPAAACATPHEAPLLIYTPAEHASADWA